jgi:uncharacterized membrane protein
VIEGLTTLFSLVCGRNPDHLWAPGGVALPFCQRCTGLYGGVACALFLLLLLRPAATAGFRWLHLALLLQMAPFGFHWVPQGPLLRTLSGTLFAFGLVGCLLLLPWRWWHTKASAHSAPPVPPVSSPRPAVPRRWAAGYVLGLMATAAALPALACWGGRPAATGLSLLAAAGALVLTGLVLMNLALLGSLGLQPWTRIEAMNLSRGACSRQRRGVRQPSAA